MSDLFDDLFRAMAEDDAGDLASGEEGPTGWEILFGDCLDVMRTMDDASVDSIVTDPPYGLMFMGKNWDHGVPGVEFWKEALRVAKPGTHLVAFGGTKTHHRLMVAIEDAGWEIRDCSHWMYGCLSEDSDALTRRGWVRGPELLEDDEVLQWDHESRTTSWVRPERILVAPYEGQMVRLKNSDTDQLLTPNHRVYACVQEVRSKGRLEPYTVIQASDLEARPDAWEVMLPCAGALMEGERIDEGYAYLVGLWLACQESWVFDQRVCMFCPCRSKVDVLRAALSSYRAQELFTPDVGHVFRVDGLLAERIGAEYQSLRSEWAWLGWDYLTRCALYRGIMDSGGAYFFGEKKHELQSDDPGLRSAFLALASSLGFYTAEEDGCVRVDSGRSGTTLCGDHREPSSEYSGTVWCVTVPKGAFVARRNGKVFITGNSGFPKSLDVSKAIDKMAGVEREVVGTATINCNFYATDGHSGEAQEHHRKKAEGVKITVPATEAAKKWSGYGTAQKPAIEPVVLARKPLEGTVARNVLKYGTGALNIDGCRVEVSEQDTEEMDRCNTPGSGQFGGDNSLIYGGDDELTPTGEKMATSKGRWPANLIWDGSDEVKALFPASSVTGKRSPKSRSSTVDGTTWGVNNHESQEYEDAGSASRYFKVTPYGEDDLDILPYYCAKANKRDRDEGCEGMEERSKGVADGTKTDNTLKGPGNSLHPDKNSKSRNFHPTVKPVNLMRYLCRLVTPPGGLVLDPFCGSGSTGKGALLEGFRFIGIEREAEYAEIARARCAHAAKKRS